MDTEQFDYYFSFMASGCIGIIREWFQRGMKEPPSEMAVMTEQMILFGAGTVNT
jgi:hypothetical protein